jgi:hypothetical protein
VPRHWRRNLHHPKLEVSVNTLDRSDFVYAVSVISAAIASLLVFCFIVLAVLSPDIEVNIPGVSRCQGSECLGGGGGD